MAATRITEGDIVEFTLRGERMTAEVMLVSEDSVLIDLFDGERPVAAPLSALADLSIFDPEQVIRDLAV